MEKKRPSVHTPASRKLGRALQSILASAQAHSFDDLYSLYRAAEATGLSEARDDAALALEMRRRVAELIFYAALDKNLPAQRCQDSLSALETLGHTDLQVRAQVYIIYARHCLDVRERAEGIRVLEALRPMIEAELSRTRASFWRDEMQICDDVLAKEFRAYRSGAGRRWATCTPRSSDRSCESIRTSNARR